VSLGDGVGVRPTSKRRRSLYDDFDQAAEAVNSDANGGGGDGSES
jgi:hypothetical protein